VFTTKVVDTPQGTTSALGAPRNQMYSFEAEPELDQLRLHVYRSARCDVIPTDIVARRTETYDGSHLVSSVDQGPVQISKAPASEVACDYGYARDVEVTLVIGNAIHTLGTTDAYGYVGVNLNAELREQLFGAGVPADAMVRVRGPKGQPAQEVGMLSLASLRDYAAGIEAMKSVIGISCFIAQTATRYDSNPRAGVDTYLKRAVRCEPSRRAVGRVRAKPCTSRKSRRYADLRWPCSTEPKA
jgi:hypothetical protein